MGSTIKGYKEVLKEMIRLATNFDKFRCDCLLKDKSVEELEEIVNNHLGKNALEKAFFAGYASAEYIQEIIENGSNDELNAFSFEMIYDFCGIEENEEEDT